MAAKGFADVTCRKWRLVPLEVLQADVEVRRGWNQNQGAMALAWEKAPPGSAAPKTAQTYEERHAQETAELKASLQRYGSLFRLGNDTSGLDTCDLGPPQVSEREAAS